MNLAPHLARVRRPWRPWYAAPEVPARRLEARTADGVRLALHRIRGPASRRPVMLLHGLGANRLAFTFPGRALAEWLAARGFDCFVIELRGAGESERPRRPWRLDDYLEQDLPAAVRTVQEVTGVARLPWIGHSMGGILWLAYALRYGAAALGRGITVGSALDYRQGESGFRRLLPLLPLVRRGRWLPFGAVVHALAPALGRVADPLTAFNVWPDNIEGPVVRRLIATVFHSIPAPLLEDLAATFTPRGLVVGRGTLPLLEAARAWSLPVLMAGGSRDVQAPLPAVEHTAALLGPRAELRRFGRADGQLEEYGHWDLLLGQNVINEVWPVFAAWLDGAED